MMRVASFNIEWMNRWFSGNRHPTWGSSRLDADSARTAAGRVARVIQAIEPDVLCVQEGPNHPAEMALFISDFLSGNAGPQYEALIGADGREQKLYVLRRLDGAAAAIEYATDEATEALRDDWDVDVDGDLILKPYDFTRLPLVVDVHDRQGPAFRLLTMHTKSKYVHRGKSLWQNEARRPEFIVQAMQARRRISAEGFRVRTYLDDLLKSDQDLPVVVTGDLNDGPGADFFERKYLTHNVSDILLGSTFYPRLLFHHPVLEHVAPASLFTARFDDFVEEINDRPLLLDHILVSPGLTSQVANAWIAHEQFDAEVVDGGRDRVDRPSDHRPVVMDLE